MTADTICRFRLRLAVAPLVLGCGASDRQAPDPSTLELTKPEGVSGDRQVGVAGEPLPDSLRVLVTRDGDPVEGVTVLWSTTEGSLTPHRSPHRAPTAWPRPSWTTMPLFAEQFASARVEGGPTVGYTAIATPDPDDPNTVLVLSEGGTGSSRPS